MSSIALWAPVAVVVLALLTVVASLAVGIAARRFVLRRRERARLARSWAELARRMGLSATRGASPRVFGEVNGFAVRLDLEVAQARSYAVFAVETHLDGVVIAPRAAAGGKLLGDAEFDHAYRAAGDPHELLGALGYEARFQMLADPCLHLSNTGTLRYVSSVAPSDVEKLERRLRWLLAVAHQLRPDRELARRLFTNVTNRKELPPVRAANLVALLEHHPGDLANRAIELALESDEPELRLHAATHKRDCDTLLRLVSDRTAHVEVRHRSWLALRQVLPDHDRLEPLLLDVLESCATTDAIALLHSLADVGTTTTLDRLRPWLESRDDSARAAATATMTTITARLEATMAGVVSLAPIEGAQGAVSVASAGGRLDWGHDRE